MIFRTKRKDGVICLGRRGFLNCEWRRREEMYGCRQGGRKMLDFE